ncbi:hypothetical protein B1A99_27545 [Cohnella sp. CIP 111063]|nr:hypothetical protein B1A99_27545 [Cohnella sp. CIP 111063]PRX62865.1 hypothetical protein B0G52_12218 [Cohnella sp. SGD-V74]
MCWASEIRDELGAVGRGYCEVRWSEFEGGKKGKRLGDWLGESPASQYPLFSTFVDSYFY